MKALIIGMTFTFIAIFCLTLLALEWLAEKIKHKRDLKDRRIRNHAVGCFSGVKDHQKRWQS